MKRLLTGFAVALMLAGTALAQNSHNYHWNSNNDDERISVRVKGEIEFSSDYRSVTSMSRDALISIRHERGRRDWRLDVERDGNEITYDYRQDGERMSFAAARTQIGDLLLMVVREGGIDAERRVARLLQAGGVDLVLDEVRLIERSGASARYLIHLVDQADLSVAELQGVAKLATEDVHSSGDRSRVLLASASQFKGNASAEQAWLAAAASVPSSGDRSRVLLKGLDVGLSPTGLFGVIKDIPSSGDKSRVLLRAMTTEMSKQDVLVMLQTVEGIASSGDKARVLLAASGHLGTDADITHAYLSAAQSIASSGDKSRVLLGLVQRASLSQAQLVSVLKTAGTISSSGDKARVLIAAAAHVEGEASEAAYLEATKTISSDGDRSRALTALLRNS